MDGGCDHDAFGKIVLEPVLSFEPLEGFLLGLSSVKFEYHSFDKSPGECHQRSGVSSIVDFFAGIRGKERLIDTIEGADYSIAQAALKVCYESKFERFMCVQNFKRGL